MTDRSGVEIDYCPKCRGVWLDRGELDKIVERAAGAAPAAAAIAPRADAAPIYQPEPARATHREEPRRRQNDDDDDDGQYRSKKRRRESFLGDLFDF